MFEEFNYEKFKIIIGIDVKKSDLNGIFIMYDLLDGVFVFFGEVVDVCKFKFVEDVFFLMLKIIKFFYVMNDINDM